MSMESGAGLPYDRQFPMYGRPSTAAPQPQPHPMYGQSTGLYPRPGQHSAPRNPPFHHSPSSSSNTGIGIRVVIKPEYRITPPPQLSTQVGDIPRSTFNFDFELEKQILAEAEKERPNWSRLGLEHPPSRKPEQTNMLARNKTNVIIDGGSKKQLMTAVPTKKSENEHRFTFLEKEKLKTDLKSGQVMGRAGPQGSIVRRLTLHFCEKLFPRLEFVISWSHDHNFTAIPRLPFLWGYTGDPIMNKYATSGFNREAVALAIANYGDNPVKVKEFAEGYTLLKEMGFSSNSVADALLMNDNDKDKAAAQLLGNSL
ncbi:putative ABC transporter C family member 10-like [Capsicum annuum]|nr:putative ABC transporter C family member 10-like [Capsicum annuum]